MASYQRVALYIFFDAIERDLVTRIRSACGFDCPEILTTQEREKAKSRVQVRGGDIGVDDSELLHGLDLGDKYSILLRHKEKLDQASSEYYQKNRAAFEMAIPIRNSTMHGRPLTTEEYSVGFAIARDFLSSPAYWPSLFATYKEYGENPDALLKVTISLWDDFVPGEVLNNLPVPDYDDTGFQPRKQLEKELKKKILGRHPVVTVLGDGGDGKTALTLQTIYGLLQSNDHDFDAFVWVSAKSNRLTGNEIERIEGAISSSLGIFETIAEQFEPGETSPIERVRRLLEQNKVLLVIDNLETVLDDSLIEFASDVPGQSKLVFTSRVPLGGDLSVKVSAFSDDEALTYLRRLIEAYDIKALRRLQEPALRRHLRRLANKPLLVKWFAIGVSSGLDPAQITADPQIALKFCMENVFQSVGDNARKVLAILAAVPQPLSATVMQSISLESSAQIESGLAELMRFGLIEKSDSSEYERLYRLKPFARSYVIRVLKLTPKDVDDILSRFRAIGSALQEERGSSKRNRYDARSFVVRNQSEAVAARRLRHAASLTLKSRFEEAHEIIGDLKISAPEYFEVYRTLAFVCFRQGDLQGAIGAYEAAFDVGEDQPQLFFFRGGFLMRSYGNHADALADFEKALEVDPNETAVLREASRASLFLYDFDAAQKHIDSAWAAGFKTFRDEKIVNDIQAQLHVRKAEHRLNTGDPRGALEAVEQLKEFLREIKPEVVDNLLIEHLAKGIRTIQSLKPLPIVVDKEILEDTLLLIRNLSPRSVIADDDVSGDEVLRDRSGALKSQGRTESFGFLKDSFNVEVYVNRTWVSSTLWKDMCEGRTVRYDIHTDSSGRKRAERIVLL
jgi:LuxR family glucitol operon transcriptional activator